MPKLLPFTVKDLKQVKHSFSDTNLKIRQYSIEKNSFANVKQRLEQLSIRIRGDLYVACNFLAAAFIDIKEYRVENPQANITEILETLDQFKVEVLTILENEQIPEFIGNQQAIDQIVSARQELDKAFNCNEDKLNCLRQG